ncbi:MAG: glycoside hydrolase domain-containing protein [Anaerolineales bacterium]
MRPPKTVRPTLMVILMVLAIVLSGTALTQAAARGGTAASATTDNTRLSINEPTPLPSSAVETDLIRYYAPLIMDPRPSAVGFRSAYTADEQGSPFAAFRPDTPEARQYVNYMLSGYNLLPDPAVVTIRWQVSGPCNTLVQFQETVTAPPGNWYHPIQKEVPSCLGIYSATAEMEYQGQVKTDLYSAHMFYVVSTESALTYISGQNEALKHGFDRGRLPTVAQMDNWWHSSPYWAFNLYLGGDSLYYKNEPLDAPWVYQVAQQGWSFILTWVGPQAPCTSFTHRITNNPVAAYLEGTEEADQAIAAALNLGFFGDKAIFYDMESYYGASDTCRTVVKEFMRGWTERLQDSGFRAGAYGSPCYYMRDWVSISPRLDDVWVANWYLNNYFYNPNASVWDVSCLSNSEWDNRQRIRQYGGDHTETWGGISLTIDSNVIDALMNVLPYDPAASANAPTTQLPADTAAAAVLGTGASIQSIELLAEGTGLVQSDNRLLITRDGGQTWQTMELPEPAEILSVSFNSPQDGWMVVRTTAADGVPLVAVQRTYDGGQTWQTTPLPISDPVEISQLAAAGPVSIDGQQGSLTFKLHTSSAFERYRSVSTDDAGRSWQLAPDTQPDTAQVPAGQEFESHATRAQSANLPAGVQQVDFLDAAHGWALVQEGSCQGEKRPAAFPGETPFVCFQTARLLATSDGGQSWQEITPAP